MIDNLVVLKALRTLADTLSVTTTGSTTLAASAAGYTRSADSFVTDGFVVGQEVTPTGFTATTPVIVSGVAALTLSIVGGLTVDASSAGRTLTTGLPAIRAWENISIDTTNQRWYVEDDYVPGPVAQIGLGALASVETFPLYTLKLYGIANTGASALYKAADALLALFAPRTAFSVGTGNSCTVRTSPAPYRGQLLQAGAGWACIPITIPLRTRAPNTY